MRAWSLASWLRLACPACGANTFKAGFFRTSHACNQCGQVFERESGLFAGAIYPFYVGTVALGGSVILFFVLGLSWDFEKALLPAAAAVLLASPWLFWYSRLFFLYSDHRFFREDA